MKFISTLLLFTFFVAFVSCGSPSSESKVGLTKVTIMYPNGPGKTFDMEYYQTQHMPMLADLFGETMKGYDIDEGVAGRTPGDDVPYLAIGYLYFESLASYRTEFPKRAKAILADIPNYTNIQPQIQISEVVK